MGRSKKSKNKLKIKKSKNKLNDYKSIDFKKKNNKVEERFLIGLYDSYRKGGEYLRISSDKDSKFKGSYSTEPIYDMVDLGIDDVIIVKDGTTSIKIEVWEVSKSILSLLEKDYSYYSEIQDELNLYSKNIVKSPFGEIILYVYNDIYVSDKFVESGDWIQYKNDLKETKKKNPKVNVFKHGYNNIFSNLEYDDKEFMD